ncbi:MAG: hypothetical protein K9J16_00645 [Melioribacteraceae bacterium]|nr:hypothetical protein [Melioribacteraceae bacterium]MCF8354100.1 hypothetical protein [Melioribacteraceae bacterium]MCF8393772.1 hypothetical protein [Melioribacteraceae bacterium]MCF8419516.1 hypothetical protein [Melioribacteraceae bacterium]
MKKIDVLCVGNASFDMIFTVEHHPQADEKMTASSYICAGGGPAANAAITAARLGFKSAFAGYLGYDFYGNSSMIEFEHENVMTSFVIRGAVPTPLSVSIVKPDGSRSLVNYRKSTKPLSENAIDFSNIEPKVILFDGHEPNISLVLLELAKAKNIITILDAGSLNDGTCELYNKVDHLICSEKFALELTGENSGEEAIEKLYEQNKNVVITLGSRGLIFKNESSSGKMPAFNVDVKDSTGAGDVFHGAFAASLVFGMTYEESLNFSSAAAAMSCREIGVRAGTPDFLEVEEFLRTNS